MFQVTATVTVTVTTAARPAVRPGRDDHGHWHRDCDTAMPRPPELFGGRFRVRVGPLLRSAASFQPASLQSTPDQWHLPSEPAPGPSGLVRASSGRVRDSESRDACAGLRGHPPRSTSAACIRGRAASTRGPACR